MKLLALLLVTALGAFAAIDGTVVNQTTGKPQSGVSVTLVKPGQGGMRTLGTTVSDPTGRFVFPNDEPGGGPQLLQASYAGVNYNKLMTPNISTSNVELPVFEATKSPAVAHVAQRMLVLEPSISQIAVNETVIVQNDSKQTFNNEATGGLQFFLPPASNGQVRISAQGPQGMPLPRTAEKTAKTDVFKINFPIKPGQTEFQITYVLPAGSPFTFRGEDVNIKGMVSSPLRLIAPSGVTLSGKDVQVLGTEPNTRATIYNVLSSGAYSFDIAGTGSLHSGGDDAAPADQGDSPQVTEGDPQIYSHMGWLVGLAFAILAVGMIVLFRSSPVQPASGK
jgi:Carboxypeptidase regulatory-like domain